MNKFLVSILNNFSCGHYFFLKTTRYGIFDSQDCIIVDSLCFATPLIYE